MVARDLKVETEKSFSSLFLYKVLKKKLFGDRNFSLLAEGMNAETGEEVRSKAMSFYRDRLPWPCFFQ